MTERSWTRWTRRWTSTSATRRSCSRRSEENTTRRCPRAARSRPGSPAVTAEAAEAAEAAAAAAAAAHLVACQLVAHAAQRRGELLAVRAPVVLRAECALSAVGRAGERGARAHILVENLERVDDVLCGRGVSQTRHDGLEVRELHLLLRPDRLQRLLPARARPRRKGRHGTRRAGRATPPSGGMDESERACMPGRRGAERRTARRPPGCGRAPEGRPPAPPPSASPSLLCRRE